MRPARASVLIPSPPMHVLVTGGAGYIGSVIAARLLTRGHAVTVYDDLSRGHAAAVPAGATLVTGDIRDAGAVRAALVESGAEAIVHMAALAEVAESVAFPERYHAVNVEGTTAVAAATRARRRARRLRLLVDRGRVRRPGPRPHRGGRPTGPDQPLRRDQARRRAPAGRGRGGGALDVVALRYFNACGADGEHGEDHDPETHLVPLALRAASEGTELRVFGEDYPTPDGTCVRDYVHVADLADAHVAALEGLPGRPRRLQPGDRGGRLGADRCSPRSRRCRAGPCAASRRPAGPATRPRSWPRTRRALATLGWRPRRTLLDAVRDAWSWMQAHPGGYAE